MLLVHGVLHLLGFDHEESPEEGKRMAEAEQSIMRALGWKGEGLIALADQVRFNSRAIWHPSCGADVAPNPCRSTGIPGAQV